MATHERRPWKIDCSARLDVLPSGGGFIVAIGPVFFWLQREAAEDLLCLLGAALDPDDPRDLPPGNSN